MHDVAALVMADAACSAAPSKELQSEPSGLGLLGQWRVIAVDGRPAVMGRDGKPSVLTFDGHGYRGYVGCNFFGGLGLTHEGRF